jgi:DNA-binding transcriptional LysR family regulator
MLENRRFSLVSTRRANLLPKPNGWSGSSATAVFHFAQAAKQRRRQPRASYGIALLPKYVVETHEPRLVEITLKGNLPERDVWLIIRRDLTKIPRVRAVADYLIELFRRQRRLLAS